MIVAHVYGGDFLLQHSTVSEILKATTRCVSYYEMCQLATTRCVSYYEMCQLLRDVSASYYEISLVPSR